MALPLPRVVADVGPGGPLVTSMMGTNALTKSNLENQIKKVEAQYAPITAQAQAASKLAYANLMGPQFLAKMLGNPDIAAMLLILPMALLQAKAPAMPSWAICSNKPVIRIHCKIQSWH